MISNVSKERFLHIMTRHLENCDYNDDRTHKDLSYPQSLYDFLCHLNFGFQFAYYMRRSLEFGFVSGKWAYVQRLDTEFGSREYGRRTDRHVRPTTKCSFTHRAGNKVVGTVESTGLRSVLLFISTIGS